MGRYVEQERRIEGGTSFQVTETLPATSLRDLGSSRRSEWLLTFLIG